MPHIVSSYEILILWALLGYLLGSIPFGMILARVMGLGNLRDIGSGNIGATNVLRTGNKTAAALTLVLDGAKGAVAVLLARLFAAEDAVQLAALTAFIGHCYPIWLSFKGGKGVATFLGLWLAIYWPMGLACCAAWAVGFGATRISSVGALAAAALSTMFALFLGFLSGLFLAFVLMLLIYWRHRANIARLKAGEEPKVGRRT